MKEALRNEAWDPGRRLTGKWRPGMAGNAKRLATGFEPPVRMTPGRSIRLPAAMEDKAVKARRVFAKHSEGNTFRCKSGVFLHPDVT